MENVLVPIHIATKAKHYHGVAYFAKSAHAKDKMNDRLNRQVDAGNLRYINKERAREILHLTVALQLRLSGQENSRMISPADLRVTTEDDIVKKNFIPHQNNNLSTLSLALDVAAPDGMPDLREEVVQDLPGAVCR